MNQTMKSEIGIDFTEGNEIRLDDFLNVGSRIFFQTHFIPLIKMQGFAKEIFLTFKSKTSVEIPILLNVKTQVGQSVAEVHCCGMIISNRNRFEKELLLAKSEAEEAVMKNEELQKIRSQLEEHQRELELQIRVSAALNRQHHNIFKVIAHDLQEPLRKSVLFADLIKCQNKDLPEAAAKKLDRIIMFNQQMRDMVMSLQRIEELENRKMNFQTIDLLSLFDKALKLSGIADETVKIIYNLKCPNLVGDRKLLQDMAIELFLNTMRFLSDKNEICQINIGSMLVKRNIFMETSDKYQYEDFIKITFADNGIGFNSDSQLVFKIFQRAEQFDGISPGLAYCRRIVELHHGTIIAKSVTGKGTGFTVLIPMKKLPENISK